MRQGASDARRILHREITEILRDPRALVAGLVLPLLLYPVLIFGMQAAQKKAQEDLEERTYRLAVVGEPGLFRDVASHLGRATLVDPRFGFRALKRGDVEVLVDARQAGRVTVYFDASREASGAAVAKVKSALLELGKERRRTRLADGGVADDPKLGVVPVITDLTEGESGTQLPLYAPLILILGVMGGASMAALDAVAGERERGTIETLLVQPVSRTAIALGKLGAVVAMAILSTLANLAAMGMAAVALPGGALAGIGAGSGALLLFLSVPLAVLLSAVLLAVTSYARSYREAQGYHYPVMVLALLPGVLPVMPGVKLDAVLAWVPVGNVALAISEILRGAGRPAFHLLAFGVTTLYATAALAAAVRLLSSEEVLSGSRDVEDAEAALARRGLAFALLAMLLTYYAGTWMQAQGVVPGLLATLWGLVLLPAIAFQRFYGIPSATAFPLRPPPGSAWVAALLVAVALPPPVLLLFRVQSYFLPAPEGLEKGFEKLLELPGWARVFCLGVSPGICEEVMFRGVLFAVLLRGFGPWRALLASSILFGAFHLSLHRLLPTTLAGAAMGAVRLGSGSLLPAVVVHATYNTLLAFHGEIYEEASRAVWGVPLSLVVLAFAWRLLRRGPPPA